MNEITKEQEADINLIARSIRGERGESQANISAHGVSLLAKLLRKNRDYGDSVFSPPLFAPDMEPGAAILVRISDKVKRLETLATHPAEVAESFQDTIDDLAGYCILWWVVCSLSPSKK